MALPYTCTLILNSILKTLSTKHYVIVLLMHSSTLNTILEKTLIYMYNVHVCGRLTDLGIQGSKLALVHLSREPLFALGQVKISYHILRTTTLSSWNTHTQLYHSFKSAITCSLQTCMNKYIPEILYVNNKMCNS